MATEELSPAAMLEAAMFGDSSLDDEKKPEAPQDDEQEIEAQDKTASGKPEGEEPEGAPIASKSGAYTIPFEKLSDARKERDQAKAEAESLRAQLDTLNARQQANLEKAQDDAQARAQAGDGVTQADKQLAAAQTAISEGIDPDTFGDFSEAGIAKGIQTLLAKAVPALREQLKAELDAELSPLRAERAKTQVDSHYAPIYAKHPDANELGESAEFKGWIEKLPSFMKAGVTNALASGTAEQVIEVFDSFKASAGAKAPANTKPSLEVQRRVPTSLSEFNGDAPVDAAQQTLAMANNPAALLARMSEMTPEQIDSMMNRV